MKYIKKAVYPFVVKADAGAGSLSFRMVMDKWEAEEMVERIFDKEGKWTGREYENAVLYAQEYIPATGIWRVCMFKDQIAYGFYQENKPGTLKASNQGFTIYNNVPEELLELTRKINARLGWDWSMYDLIWSEKRGRWLVLEITDTSGPLGPAGRKLTYYRERKRWISRKECLSPAEIIFNLFVLEEN